MKILFTEGSAKRISNAFFTVSGVAPLKDNQKLIFFKRKGGIYSVPSDVKEVGGLSTVKTEYIHSCHCKSGTVDETADISIKFDEVKVILLCLNLGGLLLGDIAKGKDILLTE